MKGLAKLFQHGTCRFLLLAMLVAAFSRPAGAYSVLTHEEVVDLLWADQIKPLLLAKFPGTSAEELRTAHAYAYGGCLIQDMGYYPFGNRTFSDLVHYVRSGDFVSALIAEAHDVNEYAFALGALAHYAADIAGHPAVNAAVAQEFPKLRAKFGPSITFEQDPKAHIRTEFGFDVVQVAKRRYTSDAYHDFIGFEVAKPQLERAFRRTYGIELKEFFLSEDLSIGTFRHSVSSVIPEMTKVALLLKKDEMVKEDPSFSKKKFLYNLKRADYEREWGKQYRKPGFGARLLALLFHLVPKVGPFRALAIQMPKPETETLYLASVNTTVEHYKSYLKKLSEGSLTLENTNFDTGKPTLEDSYDLTEHAYARLLEKLADKKFTDVPPDLRQDILTFFGSDPDARLAASEKRKPRERSKILADLQQLRTETPATEPAK